MKVFLLHTLSLLVAALLVVTNSTVVLGWISAGSPTNNGNRIRACLRRSRTTATAATNPMSTSADSDEMTIRRQRQIRLHDGEILDIISRPVQLGSDSDDDDEDIDLGTIVVWEQFEPSETVDYYWEMQGRAIQTPLDPFGLVNWPGSVVAAREMMKYYKHEIVNSTVLVLGSGTGVETQAIAMLGAKHVIATDYHPSTLQLLEYGAQCAGLDHLISTKHFDVCSTDALPECDIMVAADIMYSDRLSTVLGNRCLEARKRGIKILVSDSQRFADFVPHLRTQLGDETMIAWEDRTLDSFTGSGVLIDEDQTYEVKARVLAIGWTGKSQVVNVPR